MANRAASDTIKTVAANLFALVAASPGGWASLMVKDEAGAVDVEETKRAINRALSTHLRDTGVLKSAGFAKTGPAVDYNNLYCGIYFSFSKCAKGDAKASVSRTELVYTVLYDMAVPPADMEKAKRIVTEAITAETSPFVSAVEGRKFDGAKVTLRAAPPGGVLAPVAFRPWSETFGTPAPVVPAAAPASVEAPKPAKGKGKGK